LKTSGSGFMLLERLLLLWLLGYRLFKCRLVKWLDIHMFTACERYV
jgi:hypothetical protein